MLLYTIYDTNYALVGYNLVCSCWSPIERLPRWQIVEVSPDTVSTGEIKYPVWTKTSITAFWRRETFKG